MEKKYKAKKVDGVWRIVRKDGTQLQTAPYKDREDANGWADYYNAHGG